MYKCISMCFIGLIPYFLILWMFNVDNNLIILIFQLLWFHVLYPFHLSSSLFLSFSLSLSLPYFSFLPLLISLIFISSFPLFMPLTKPIVVVRRIKVSLVSIDLIIVMLLMNGLFVIMKEHVNHV